MMRRRMWAFGLSCLVLPALVAVARVDRTATQVLGATEIPSSSVTVGPSAPSPTSGPDGGPLPGVGVVPPSTLPPGSLAAGTHELEISTSDGIRAATIVVPPATGRLRSMMILLHGVGGTGASMRNMGFEPLAAPSGTVLVYPDGLDGAWNDGRPGTDPVWASPPDDVAFVRLLIEEVAARTGVDRRRVGVAGFSNGAMMASRVACELSDAVAGVALVGGAGGGGFAQWCGATRPVSLVLVSGTADPVVPYAGGRVADFDGKKRGIVAPVSEVVSYWAARAGCSGLAERAVGPGISVVEVGGQGCRSAAIVHYRVLDGGHEWVRNGSFDTTEAVWDVLHASSLR